MINPIKLLLDWNKFNSINKEKGDVMQKLSQYLTLVISLAGTLGVPALAQHWLATPSHKVIYTGLVAFAILLHAIFPSVFADPSDTVKKSTGLGVILLMLAFSGMANAQTVTPTAPTTTVTFTGGSDVIAMRYGGAWGTGNLTTESFDFMDFGKGKVQHLFIEGKELIGTQAGINVYTGGVKYQPDLSKILAKTNVSPANFGLYVSGSGGAGTFSAGGSHVALMLGGGIEYRSNSQFSWNPLQFQYLRIGNQNAAVISTGLSFIFGQK